MAFYFLLNTIMPPRHGIPRTHPRGNDEPNLPPLPPLNHEGTVEFEPNLQQVLESQGVGAHDYFGSVDLAKAEKWFTDLVRVFDIVRCLNKDWVHLATFLLKRNTYSWWETIQRSYPDPNTITWANFQRMFNEQFYPPSYQDAKPKQAEFLGLKQGQCLCWITSTSLISCPNLPHSWFLTRKKSVNGLKKDYERRFKRW